MLCLLFVGEGGIEPPTFCLCNKCSILIKETAVSNQIDSDSEYTSDYQSDALPIRLFIQMADKVGLEPTMYIMYNAVCH